MQQIARKGSALACVLSCVRLCVTHTGSSVHGTFQPRILEWVAIFSSRGILPASLALVDRLFKSINFVERKWIKNLANRLHHFL